MELLSALVEFFFKKDDDDPLEDKRNRRLQLSSSGSLSSQIEIVAADEIEKAISTESSANGKTPVHNDKTPADNEQRAANTDRNSVFTEIEIPIEDGEKTKNPVSDKADLDEKGQAPLTEGDSAFGSGIDEDDDLEVNSVTPKNVLHRLESKEHNIGEEEYILVDFINEGGNNEQVCLLEPIEEYEQKQQTTGEVVQVTDEEDIEISETHGVEGESPFATLSHSFKADSVSVTKEESEFKLITPQISEEVVADYDSISLPSKKNSSERKAVDIQMEDELTTKATDAVAKKSEDKKAKGLKRQDVVDSVSSSIDETKRREIVKDCDDIEQMKPEKSKKKVFSAGKGLKKGGPEDAFAGNGISDTENSLSPEGVNLNSSFCTSGSTSPTPITSSSPGGSISNSPRKPTRTSRSSSSETPPPYSPGSLVKQNAQLFDKHIADNLRSRYTTPPDVLKPRLESAVKKDGVKNMYEGESLTNKQRSISPLDSEELDLSGKVSGARSLFERGSVSSLSGRSDTTSDKKKNSLTSSNDIQNISTTTATPNEQAVDGENTTQDENKTKKKKKNPFKKKKHKNEKDSKSDSDAMTTPEIINIEESYDERAIDVPTIALSTGSDTKPETGSDNSISPPEIIPTPRRLTPPPLQETNGGDSDNSKSVEAYANEEEDIVPRTSSFATLNRNSKKKPRLAKKRGSDTYVPKEEIPATEVILTDNSSSSISFDKLAQLEVDEDEPTKAKNASPETVQVYVDPAIFTETKSSLLTLKPVEVDINSLDNESCVDENEITLSSPSGPITSVTESDTFSNSDAEGNKTNLTADTADHDHVTGLLDNVNGGPTETTESFYDGDNTSLELSLEMDSSAAEPETEKKKKKKFPFRISLGKKEKNKKGKTDNLGENGFDDTKSTTSSLFTPKTKKKNKNKDKDHLDVNGKKLSVSSIETGGMTSSVSNLSLASDRLEPDSISQGHEKDKSKKKMNFFKKKKSGTSTPILPPPVSGQNGNLDTDNINGHSNSNPVYLNSNGHSNYDEPEGHDDRLI